MFDWTNSKGIERLTDDARGSLFFSTDFSEGRHARDVCVIMFFVTLKNKFMMLNT